MWDFINKDAHWFQSVPWFNGNYLKTKQELRITVLASTTVALIFTKLFTPFTIYPLYY